MPRYKLSLAQYIKSNFLINPDDNSSNNTNKQINTIKTIILQIIDVVKKCSDNKIIIGDLKSSNIMVNLDNNNEFISIKLIDYIYDIYDDECSITSTFPSVEALCLYNFDKDTLNFNKINDYNWTFDYAGLFNVILEIIFNISFYNYLTDPLLYKYDSNNDIFDVIFYYSFVYYFLDEETYDNKINNYNFNNTYKNIFKLFDEISKINKIDRNDKQLLLKLHHTIKIFNDDIMYDIITNAYYSFNNINKHNLIIYFTNKLNSILINKIDTNVLFKFLFKLIRFKYNDRCIDYELLDNIFI